MRRIRLNSRLLVTVVVVLLGGAAARAGSDDTVALRYNQAMQALNRQDYPAAVALLTELVAEHPERRDLRIDLATAHRRGGAIEPARAVLEALLAENPRDETAAGLLADMLAAQERWPEVVALLEPLARAGGTFENHERLAAAFEALDDAVNASWFYTRATELNPAAVGAWRRLARLHLHRALPALAVRALERAVALEAGHAATHLLLARAYLAAGRPLGRLAVMPLSSAVVGSTYRDTENDWYVYDAIEDEPHRYLVCAANSAIYHVQRARESGADVIEADLLEADIWFDAQELGRARALYSSLAGQRAVADQAGYHERYARTLLELNDPAGFEKHILIAVRLDEDTYAPQLATFYEALAQRYCLRGELDHYIQYLRSAVREAPKSARLHYKLAEALAEAGRGAEAARHWQATLQLEPSHPQRIELLERIRMAHAE